MVGLSLGLGLGLSRATSGFNAAAQGNLYFEGTSISGNKFYSRSGDERDLQPRYVRQLNGLTQYGTVPDNTDLDITDHLTVIVRAKNDNALLSGDQFLISKYNTTGNQREWAVGISSTKLFVNLFGASGTGAFAGQRSSDSAISNLDQTNTFIMTFSGGTVVQNVNGFDIASTTTTGTLPTSLFNGTDDLHIGSRTGTTVTWDGEIYEVILLKGTSGVPTEAQCLDIHNSINANPAKDIQNTVYGLAGQTVVAHYKLDENTGTTFFDSSGSGNNGTWQNSPTIATTTQNVSNYPNSIGYTNNGGLFVPRDEDNITNDVQGNPLGNVGPAKRFAFIEGSNALTFNGTSQRIDAAHLTGSETVVRSGGTSTPSISAGQIDFTAGTCWDLLLSDGTYYPMAEGAGDIVFDVSGNGNDGTLINFPTVSTQDDFAYNIASGFNKYMYFDGTDRVELDGMTATGNYFGACTIQANVYVADISSTRVVWSLGASAYRLYIASGDWRLNGAEVVATAELGWVNIAVDYNASGEAIEFRLDGVTIWTGTAAAGTGATKFEIGSRSAGLLWLGVISDFSITGSSVKNFAFDGYGNTHEDWVDTTGGGNNAQVIGAPANYRVPKLSTANTDAFGETLRNAPVVGHNDAESTFDFINVGVGGVAIPETAFMDASFATVEFDEDWSTFNYAFYRPLSNFANDRYLVYASDLVGVKLDNVLEYTAPPSVAPNSISDLIAWWDISDTSTFSLHSGTAIGNATVDEISSKVGTNALQSLANFGGGSNRPAYVYGANGRPALSNVDNSETGMASNSSTLFDSGRTFFTAQRFLKDSATTFINGGLNTTGTIFRNSSNTVLYSDIQGGGDAILETGVTRDNLFITCVCLRSDSLGEYYEDSKDTTPVTFDPLDSGLGINFAPMGRYNGGSGTGLQDWHETLVYDRALTPAEIKQVLQYLENKWRDVNALTGFLLAGQSNAKGEGTLGLSSAFPYDFAKHKIWGYDDELRDFDISVAIADETNSKYPVYASANIGYSLGASFMNYVSRRYPGQIVVMPAALDGAQIIDDTEWGERDGDFNKSTLFGATNERLRVATEYGINFVGSIWQQGVSDTTTAVAATEAEYTAAFNSLVDDIHAAQGRTYYWSLGVIPDSLPAGSFPNRAEVQAAQLNFTKANVTVYDSSGVATSGDNIHWGIGGLDILGPGHGANLIDDIT